MTPSQILSIVTTHAAQINVTASVGTQLTTITNFCIANPDMAYKPRSSKFADPAIPSYWVSLVDAFVKGRQPTVPVKPSTIPDEVVSIIMEQYFGINPAHRERIKVEHQYSMASENIVGDLLERYLATVLEPLGWVWCSGSIVRAVDFIKPGPLGWTLLQVKNRDNSENSSSSAIRGGTTIEKWFRSFSKRNATNWEAFPDSVARPKLSEEGFRSFVVQYLKQVKATTLL